MKKNKKKNIRERNTFKCDWCKSKFKDEPYAVVAKSDTAQPIKICNQGCWRSFLCIEAQFMDDLFHDEVLISYPVDQLIEFLQDRNDYDEVLKYIKGSIEEFRPDGKKDSK